MTADDLRALSTAAAPGPWVRDGYEVLDVAIAALAALEATP